MLPELRPMSFSWCSHVFSVVSKEFCTWGHGSCEEINLQFLDLMFIYANLVCFLKKSGPQPQEDITSLYL